MSLPWLSILFLGPLLAALLVALAPVRWARWLAAASMGGSLLAAGAALLAFLPAGARFQLIERMPWVPMLGIDYFLAVDGLSVLFLPATALLFLGTLVVGWRQPGLRDGRGVAVSLLALQSITVGVFCAMDLVLFFLCWELSILPVYALLCQAGVTAGARAAATRYALLMLGGGFPLLLAIVILIGGAPAGAADLPNLLAEPLPLGRQYLILGLGLLAFGLKVPLVPLHTWLPPIALAGPGGLTALLVGLKIGAYGLIRFALPLAPQAAADAYWLLAGLGTVSVIYGAVGMLAQSNLRVAMAYSSISHVGLVVLGVASLTVDGVLGGISLLLNFALATGGSFLLLACLHQRTGSTDVAALGGIVQRAPWLAAGVLFCGLAGIGLPLTSGFHGEWMLIAATLGRHTGAGMAALFGLAIGASAFVALYRQAFWGEVRTAPVAPMQDLTGRERAVLWSLFGLILVIGLYPAPWLDIVRPAAQAWAAGFGR